ncbi:hypothetical protein [Mycobacteroides abscessus]|uniref:hypothetical protein n=1 Tax=Mycobacteroides abscessus TaxID=36809 RepID=UPI000C25B6F7|nr:hypothetical protein [Mycobacteroides abscessus]
MNNDQRQGSVTADCNAEKDRRATALAEDAFRSVTRLVVEKEGVYTEFWADSWIVDIQDDGRTAKLFAKGTGVAAARTAAEWLGAPAVAVDTVASSDAAINAAMRDRFPTTPIGDDHESLR